MPPASADSLPPTDAEDWIEIGRIVAPQGVKGELRVYPSSDFPERFTVPGPRWLQRSPHAAPEPIELLAGRFLSQKGLYIVRIDKVEDRSAAEAMRNARLLIPASDRPELEDGEYHIRDLIGLPVYQQSTGELAGTVISVRQAGNDILEIEIPAGDSAAPKAARTALIPFVEAIVPIVDLTQGRIEITPPAGLLDL